MSHSGSRCSCSRCSASCRCRRVASGPSPACSPITNASGSEGRRHCRGRHRQHGERREADMDSRRRRPSSLSASSSLSSSTRTTSPPSSSRSYSSASSESASTPATARDQLSLSASSAAAPQPKLSAAVFPPWTLIEEAEEFDRRQRRRLRRQKRRQRRREAHRKSDRTSPASSGKSSNNRRGQLASVSPRRELRQPAPARAQAKQQAASQPSRHQHLDTINNMNSMPEQQQQQQQQQARRPTFQRYTDSDRCRDPDVPPERFLQAPPRQRAGHNYQQYQQHQQHQQQYQQHQQQYRQVSNRLAERNGPPSYKPDYRYPIELDAAYSGAQYPPNQRQRPNVSRYRDGPFQQPYGQYDQLDRLRQQQMLQRQRQYLQGHRNNQNRGNFNWQNYFPSQPSSWHPRRTAVDQRGPSWPEEFPAQGRPGWRLPPPVSGDAMFPNSGEPVFNSRRFNDLPVAPGATNQMFDPNFDEFVDDLPEPVASSADAAAATGVGSRRLDDVLAPPPANFSSSVACWPNGGGGGGGGGFDGGGPDAAFPSPFPPAQFAHGPTNNWDHQFSEFDPNGFGSFGVV